MGILEDLNDLISYSWEDEERHFEETEEGENKENHVFNSIKRVKDWLESPACPLVSEGEEEEGAGMCEICGKVAELNNLICSECAERSPLT